MDKAELAVILDKHLKWLADREGGARADLGGADLGGADLRGAYLGSANLRGANLGSANLCSANLRGADLGGADLRGAYLGSANLRGANLRGADLGGAYLCSANLCSANLRGADLGGANLSQALGVKTAREFFEGYETDTRGLIAYKCISGSYEPPASWVIAPGKTITEAVNPDRGTECGSGINLASLEWVQRNYPGKPIWRCRIAWRDLPDVVVPFGSDGKFRAARVRLLNIVEGTK